jgi:hypothetical protein
MTTAAKRARWYLETIVKPTVAECVAEQLDVRRAFLAAIVVSHLADYIAQVPPRDKIKDLVQGCDFLAIARNVSDAAKHGTLTRNNIIIEPPNVDAVQNDVIEFWGLGHGSGPHGALPESDGKYRYPGVFVRRCDGHVWLLYGVVQEAMWFLERKLAAKGEASPAGR